MDINMQIKRLTKSAIKPIIEERHYSKKLGIFWEGYALIENGEITGVCVYGQPSAMIQKHAFKDKDFRLYELTRLVVWSENRNARSYLIANSLKMLSVKPSAVISYADSNFGHCGIVYQATNWNYTGAPTACGKNVLIDGKIYHPQTLTDMGIKNQHKWAKEKGYELIPQKPKHRYFFFNGDKREVRKIKSKLNYNILGEYPKVNKSMYPTDLTNIILLDEYLKTDKKKGKLI
tara:strand:+ start:674 stop:1372 length:699 start_codon:yes stop_codon:yes gene_type:complete